MKKSFPGASSQYKVALKQAALVSGYGRDFSADYFMALNGFLSDNDTNSELDNVNKTLQGGSLISPDICVRLSIFPESFDGQTLKVKFANPLSDLEKEEISTSFATTQKLKRQSFGTEFIPADSVWIKNKISTLSKHAQVESKLKEIELNSGSGALMSDLFKEILSEAISIGASDIHIVRATNNEAYNYIAYRVNGELDLRYFDTEETIATLIRTIKSAAENMDISNNYRGEDGKYRFVYNNRKVDLRIIYQPLYSGERMVLRLADSKNLLPIKRLFPSFPEITERLLDITKIQGKEQGLVLVCGSTGHGKTTTLYAALREIDRTSYHVVTIEDPVEYELPLASQIQYNQSIHGDSMSPILRAVVREDPDVIMVGEIRDYDTLVLALQAAQSGHLVLASLHTNNVLQTLNRLLAMTPDGEKEKIADMILSILRCIIHQKLEKQCCPKCSIKTEITDENFKELMGVSHASKVVSGLNCDVCGGTGVVGRVAIPEALFIDGLEQTSNSVLEKYDRGIGLSSILGVKGVFYESREESVKKLIQLGQIDINAAARVLGMYVTSQEPTQ